MLPTPRMRAILKRKYFKNQFELKQYVRVLQLLGAGIKYNKKITTL